jgi:hypothetical protein
LVLELEIVERGDEIWSPIEQMEEQLATEQVTSAIRASLNRQQRDVLERRFGFHDGEIETLESIGDRYSVSRERIRQIEKNALKNLGVSYWSGISWFQRAACEQGFSRFRHAEYVALRLLDDPALSDRALASDCGVEAMDVAALRGMIEIMAQEATRLVGAFGEPIPNQAWGGIFQSAVLKGDAMNSLD